MTASRSVFIWIAFALAIAVPVAAAGTSPLLAYRDAIYITAGFAGVIALCLLLVQPTLIGGYLPAVPPQRGRRVHRWVGVVLVVAVLVHVGGLWLTSPPDVIDALMFASPTPFSAWGVVAMWAIFASALLALFRHRLGLRPRTWRIAHASFAAVIVVGSVVHAVLIEGTMETFTKVALCALVLAVTARVFLGLRLWPRRRPRPS